ncbi:MAG: serpin family protein [Bdellovibrionota bacterium]
MKLFSFFIFLFFCASAAADTGAAAAQSMNQLGLDLFRAVQTPGENICLSPYSIQTALAMTYAGADGDTRDEMASVLHARGDDAAFHRSVSGLQHELSEVAAKSKAQIQDVRKYGGTPGDPIIFQWANRLYGKSGYTFRDAFLTLLNDVYGAPLEQVEFSDAVAEKINLWVEEQTAKRIRNLIPNGVLDSATRLVLVNALYLKAPWAESFSAAATKDEPFHVRGGAGVAVPTMNRQDHYGYASLDGYSLVTIPYVGFDLQFVLIVPDAVNGLPEIEKKLSPEIFAKAAAPEYKDVILHLPKFKLESGSIMLSRALQELGMHTAFDDPKGSANFDRMAERKPNDYLLISEVIHKTFFAIDEKGTEAAAATAVVMLAGAAMNPNPPKPIEVKVDRPFLFAVQHKASGAVLFLGRVTDPKAH